MGANGRSRDADGAAVLAGGGVMGALMRTHDWAATPLGSVEQWPQALTTCVRIMLTSRQPMWLGWGDELTFLYNDPYRAIAGNKHPYALGQPTAVVWREIWHDIAPRIQAALGGDLGTYDEALLLIMERHGYPEETYYTFSYSPIPGDDGQVAGIFCANSDDTRRVIGERQLSLLRDLAAGTTEARTIDDACTLSLRILETNSYDVPFALLYRVEPDHCRAVLLGTANIAPGHPAAPVTLRLDRQDSWPLESIIRSKTPCVIPDLKRLFGPIPNGAWDRPPTQAAALPITPSGPEAPARILIAGLNPYRPYDDDYRRFMGLVAARFAAAIADASAYEEASARAEALAEIDRAKTAFFNNISHEFRTPLTLMLGPLEDMLAAPADTNLVREQAAIAHRNSLRLLRLVNTLLDFSRVEGARMTAAYEPTDLSRLTAELAGVFRAAIERAGLRLVVECPSLPEPVYTDHEMWEKIVLNLLSNAFKFTLTGQIAVTLRASGGNAVLTVRDTGTGIPAEELPRIFERFHRVRGARARTHEGTGIGLALAHDLIRLHGGAIDVVSTLGEGTTFTVTLPLGTAHLPPEHIHPARTQRETARHAAPYVEEALHWLPPTDAAAERPVIADASTIALADPQLTGDDATRRARVLLADDNADLREYLTRLLAERYAVQAVANGAEALAHALAAPPDLVLSDIMMPELDGFGLLRALRANPSTSAIPVVLLSARAGEEAAAEGLASGADDYLVKPFSARELVARVQTRIELARLRARTAETLRRRARQAELAAEVGAALTDGAPWLEQLQRCAEALVRHLDAAFARIWTFDEPEQMLVLRAGAGLYTRLDGPFSRVPLGEFKIGRVALERRPHLTNDVMGDSLTGDQEWARREGMVAFAGYPLVVGERLIGVMALFARHELADAALISLGSVADEIALGIARAWADEERDRLLIQEQAARREAEATRQHLHDLFMQAPAAIFILHGPQHVFTLANPRFLHMIGERDVVGKPVRDALPEVAGQRIYELLENLYATGQPYVGSEVSAFINRGAGELEERFYNFAYEPIRNAQDVVGDVFFHAVDVTEQVRARQHVEQLARELQAERDRLRKVVELLPTAVLVTDTALTIQVGNRAARMLLGVDGAAPAPPVAAGETIPADDVGIFAAYEVRRLDGTPYEAAELPLTRALRQGEEVRGEQMLLRHSDGHDVPILTSAAPLYDETGAITSAVLVFQEITAIRELEQAREEFLSSAAHDLRTPLTSIQGLAELARWRLNRLGMDNLGPIAAHMEGIEAASSRMARLIDSLADISRARLGAAFELESSHVDLVTLVETVVTRFAEQGTHRVNFITEVPTLPITLDALRFERVVDNLVSNAIKYSSSGGEINVRVAREEAGTEPSAIVEVEDHGIGIGAADQARIFERFHRAAGVRGHIPGSGVGLASVMQIIRQLGGTIMVRSHEGEGSTFTVRLPLEVETGDSSALHRGE